MTNSGDSSSDRPYYRFLDACADVLQHTFAIVVGGGATLLAIPVFFSLVVWLIMWPLSGLFDIESLLHHGRKGAEQVEHAGEQFWAYWGQALVFLAIYGGIGWPLRAVFVDRAESPHEGRRTHKPSGQNLTLSWQTFWFVVVAVAAGSLAASAIRQIFARILDLLEAALVTVIIPTSRAAVALALITTALERWANWWVKQRQSEVRP